MRSSWRHRMSYVILPLVLMCVCTLTGCAGASGQSQITVAGSTTVLPIAEIAAEQFHKDHPDMNVLVSGLGSSAGIEACIDGTCDIASSSRDLTAEEQKAGLYKVPIAHDGIAIIVNETNPVRDLSSQQLKDIYIGKITNWKEVGGPDLSIQPVNRDEASGTREAFRTIIMKGADFDRSQAVLPGTGQVRDVVSRTPGAIGYISIGFVDTPYATTKVNALKIDGIEPTETTVTEGTYPISRDLYFFTARQPEGKVKEFIDFILSDKMDKTIKEAGYIPIGAGESKIDQGSTR